MDQESYRILQVEESATDEEIKASYERLKAFYNEEKWKDGEAGNEAARMLGKLDAAYSEIMESRREREKNTSGASSIEAVGDAIRAGDINRAQQLLDDFNERSAEWHYLQSVVFYRKHWMNESKKQLEIAMQMDPSQSKYREAYEKLSKRAEYKGETGGAPNTNPDPDPVPGDEQMGGSWCTQCFSFCYACLCVNCLFNLCCNCH